MTTHDRRTLPAGVDGSGRSRDRGDARRRIGLVARTAGSLLLLGLVALGCSASDSGGMSGTGVSQGSIDAFGSIFVNGVEWELGGATVEVEGAQLAEADLRLGMVVQVEGDFGQNGLSGRARRVTADDAIEGPIESDPIETIAGLERSFPILGTTIVMRVGRTVFADGALFDGLRANDVVEVSGFVDPSGAIQATRIELVGVYPAEDRVELRGDVANLVRNPDDSGIFDLGPIVIRYDATTRFAKTSRSQLAEQDRVEVEGRLRPSGTEVDASEIERESTGLGVGDRDDVELEGIVVACVAPSGYCVGDVPIDDAEARFEPSDFVPMPGDRVEVEGRLRSGVLIAEQIESEDADETARNVRIDAAITSVDAEARTLVVLGVTVVADGRTRLEDESEVDDERLTFSALAPGQFIEIEGIATGTSSVRALSIDREDATAGSDDVRLEGPVTSLDPDTPALEVLGQTVPVDAGTVYRDADGQVRSEEQFFRVPGDVLLGDIVRARDRNATALSTLGEADEVEIRNAGELVDDDDDEEDDS
ncbi:MAG: DUF5666 domain-containing protein [Myxococcota bacterium]